MTEQIVTEVVLTGADQAAKDLQNLGNVGEKAFNQINTAAEKLPDVGNAISNAFGKLGSLQLDRTKVDFNALGTSVKNARQEFGQMIPQATTLKSVIESIGKGFKALIEGFDSTSDATKGARENIQSTGREIGTFGSALKTLGRVAGIPALGQTSQAIQGVGRAASIAGPLIATGLVVALERLASAGVDAARASQSMAASLGITVGDLSKIQGIGSAAGLSTEKFGDSLKALNTLVKASADGDKAAANAQDAYNDSIKNSAQASELARRGYRDLSKDKQDLLNGLAEGTVSFQQFDDAMVKINDRERDLRKSTDDIADSQIKAEKALRDANEEAFKQAEALKILGINALGANGKLKEMPETLFEIADALKAIGPGQQQVDAGNKLVAAGLDAALIPVLNQGADALRKFNEEGLRAKPAITEEQIKLANEFAATLQLVKDSISGIFQQAGLAIAPAFLEFFKQLEEIFIRIRPGIVEFAGAIGRVLGPVLTGIGTVITSVVIPAIELLFRALDFVASQINSLFGTDLTGVDIFVGALTALAIAFGGVATAIVLVVTTIGLLIQKLQDSGVNFDDLGKRAQAAWDFIRDGVTGIVQYIIDKFTEGKEFLENLFDFIAGLPQKAWDTIVEGVQELWVNIVAIWNQGVARIVGVFQPVIDALERAKQLWNELIGSASSSDPNAAAGGGAFAGGGHIRGPGGPTGDRIPIWASDGEFMVKTRAVQKMGLGFMHALNNLQLDPGMFNFASGGLVSIDAPKMAFAEGGLIQKATGKTLTLVIDGHTFQGMTVPEDVAGSLEKFAVNRQLRSGGKKPNWYGNR